MMVHEIIARLQCYPSEMQVKVMVAPYPNERVAEPSFSEEEMVVSGGRFTIRSIRPAATESKGNVIVIS